MLVDLPAEDLDRLRLIKREEADDAIAFANAMVKTRYDDTHKSINLKEGSLVYLRLHHGYSIPGVNPKLSNQRVGPFKVLKKVGNLAYKLELPDLMRIHPVISIAQLEPASDRSEDPYSRTPAQPPPPVEEENESEKLDPEFTAKFPLYEIERLLGKRGSGSTAKYLVKWKGYGNQHNAWYPTHALPQDLMKEYDVQITANPTRNRRISAQAPTSQASTSQALIPIQNPADGTLPGAEPASLAAPKKRGRPRKTLAISAPERSWMTVYREASC